MKVKLEARFENELTAFGNHISELRQEMELGKEKFGELCNLSEKQIRKIEDGSANITLETLSKMKTSLNTSIALLLNYNSDRVFSKRTIEVGKKETFFLAKANFSKRLSHLAAHRGLKSLQLSILIGMDESATRKYLNGNGNPTYLTMLKFAMALKVEVIDFFDYYGLLPDNIGYKQEVIV